MPVTPTACLTSGAWETRTQGLGPPSPRTSRVPWGHQVVRVFMQNRLDAVLIASCTQAMFYLAWFHRVRAKHVYRHFPFPVVSQFEINGLSA